VTTQPDVVVFAFGSLICGLAAAKNLYDATHDSWRSIRILSWILVPTFLAMGVLLGVSAFMEAMK